MSRRILATVVLVILLSPLPAGAQVPARLSSPGLIPGNVFYLFDTMFDGIGTFFTFGQESKARRYLALAEERLSELNALAVAEEAESQSDEATDRIQQALAGYEERLDDAVSIVDEMETEGEEVEGLATEIAEATLKHLEVLARVHEQVPEAAKQAIQRAMKASGKGHDTAVEAPDEEAGESEVVEDVAQDGKQQIDRLQQVRQAGVPVPRTETERRVQAAGGAAQGVPPGAGPPAGTPGGPPAGTPGGPPAGTPGGPPAGTPGGPPAGTPGGPPAGTPGGPPAGVPDGPPAGVPGGRPGS